MKQRALLESAGGDVLDHQRAGRERGRHACIVERARGDEARARCIRPDGGEVALARPSGPVRTTLGWRPVRPSVDERQCGGIGGAAEEILAREIFRVTERERELTRAAAFQRGTQVPVSAAFMWRTHSAT